MPIESYAAEVGWRPGKYLRSCDVSCRMDSRGGLTLLRNLWTRPSRRPRSEVSHSHLSLSSWPFIASAVSKGDLVRTSSHLEYKGTSELCTQGRQQYLQPAVPFFRLKRLERHAFELAIRARVAIAGPLGDTVLR